jgi:hypothetical protein
MEEVPSIAEWISSTCGAMSKSEFTTKVQLMVEKLIHKKSFRRAMPCYSINLIRNGAK